MPITSSSIKAVQKNLYEFHVLLVNPSKKTLQHHAYFLFQSSYRVTSTMKISEALSMIISGNRYDCVLFDADNDDMNLVDILRVMWNHQPQLRIIVMTSNKSHIKLAREFPANDLVWFLEKPCGVSSICDLLQIVCRKASGEGTSTVQKVNWSRALHGKFLEALTALGKAVSSSAVTEIPKRFSGLQVLLVEPDERSLQHHADMLKQNSYRVTTTTKASYGLSMLMNEHTYDCVLIDADICETDMAAFLNQVLMHQRQMSIVLMASDDIHLRISKEALESEAVLCLRKPCSLMDIRDIWKHICRNRISLDENVLKQNLHSEDQVRNNIHGVDPKAKLSATNNNTVINNNISSGNFTDHQTTNINPKECEVTYGDLFSNDGDDDGDDDNQEDVDEIATKENAGIGTTETADKGKQQCILKRKNDQPVEDDTYPKKRNKIKKRITWKGELDGKFMDALKELGDQAHSRSILKHMNVPGLTRCQVASHLQKYNEKQKSIEACMAALAQRSNSFQAERFATERCQLSTQYDNASIIDQSNLLGPWTLNFGGAFYVLQENVRARLQKAEAPPLPVPQLARPIDNYGGYQATCHSSQVVENFNSVGRGTEIQQIGHGYGNAMEPQVTGEMSSNHAFGEAMPPLGFGETVVPDYNLGIDADYLLGRLNNGEASGSGLHDVQKQLDCFGPATDPWVAGCGGVADFLQGDAGGLLPSQDFQGNGENLYPVFPQSATPFDVENCVNPDPSLNSIPFGPASADFLIPELPQDFQCDTENLHPAFPHSVTPLGVENSISLGPNLDSIPFGTASADFPIPERPTEDNVSLAQIHPPVNSAVPLEGSEGNFIYNDLREYDLESSLGLLSDYDSNFQNIFS